MKLQRNKSVSLATLVVAVGIAFNVDCGGNAVQSGEIAGAPGSGGSTGTGGGNAGTYGSGGIAGSGATGGTVGTVGNGGATNTGGAAAMGGSTMGTGGAVGGNGGTSTVSVGDASMNGGGAPAAALAPRPVCRRAAWVVSTRWRQRGRGWFTRQRRRPVGRRSMWERSAWAVYLEGPMCRGDLCVCLRSEGCGKILWLVDLRPCPMSAPDAGHRLTVPHDAIGREL
jgi:hypothetical protein